MNDNSPPASELSVSDDYSHYSNEYGTEASARSTLADLLERFTIEAQPECTLKLRSKVGPVVVGADLTRITAANSNVGALVLKPAAAGQPWRRLRVDNSGTLTLRSRKLHWWLLTLDVIGHANPLTRTFDLSYRVATKWDVARGEYRNKKRLEVSPGVAEARAHWSISYSLPAIEGSMGTAAAQRGAKEVHADVGYAHLDIPRLELVVWPRGRPSAAASSSPAEGSSSAAAAAEAAAGEEGEAGSSGDDAGSCLDAAASEVVGGGSGAGAGFASVGSAAGLAAQQQKQQQKQPPQFREYLPHYLRGEGSAGTATAVSGGSGRGGQRRKASLQQLSSHVASLSGRWWEAFGSGSGASC